METGVLAGNFPVLLEVFLYAMPLKCHTTRTIVIYGNLVIGEVGTRLLENLVHN